MREEKHQEILAEVMQTVEEALKSEDLLRYQRRLAAMLSLGAQQLVELHLHRHHAVKPGAQIKHDWFGLSERNFSVKLAAVLTTDRSRIPDLDEMLALARMVEAERNDLVYGSPLIDGRVLRKKLDAFLEMKRIVDYGQKS